LEGDGGQEFVEVSLERERERERALLEVEEEEVCLQDTCSHDFSRNRKFSPIFRRMLGGTEESANPS
jgi:hypothetical protein